MSQTILVSATASIQPHQIKPRFDYVVVQPIFRERVTEAGIELAKDVEQENIGVVQAVGPWCVDPSLAPPTAMVTGLSVGDTVLYVGTHHQRINTWSTNELLILMRSASISGVVEFDAMPVSTPTAEA